MEPDFNALRLEIIDRFEKNIQAHWDKDVDFIMDDLGEGFFSMFEAEITYPSKEDQKKCFTAYLNYLHSVQESLRTRDWVQ